MKNLMHQYKLTATTLYKAILRSKEKKRKNEEKYHLLLTEYQQACSIHKQITNYCKVRGIL